MSSFNPYSRLTHTPPPSRMLDTDRAPSTIATTRSLCQASSYRPAPAVWAHAAETVLINGKPCTKKRKVLHQLYHTQPVHCIVDPISAELDSFGDRKEGYYVRSSCLAVHQSKGTLAVSSFKASISTLERTVGYSTAPAPACWPKVLALNSDSRCLRCCSKFLFSLTDWRPRRASGDFRKIQARFSGAVVANTKPLLCCIATLPPLRFFLLLASLTAPRRLELLDPAKI